ncbi:hypothetical protein K6U06_10695 [Acidiferrimicrobium sp. IK]|nr:hypothetical protein [Acidiferrimicrobium sp. IK]
MTVVLLLLGVVLPIGYEAVTAAQRESVAVSNRNSASNQAELAADVLTRQLRAAIVPAGLTSPVLLAGANEMKWYSSLGNPLGPTLVDAYVSTVGAKTVLQETLSQPVAGGGYGAAVTTTLATGVVVPGAAAATNCPSAAEPSTALFQYATLSGAVWTCAVPSADPLAAVTLTVTTTALASASAIVSPPTTITATINLRNVDYAN